MADSAWIKEFPGAVTVCDLDGIILSMNEKSAQTFAADGGENLIGRNALDCHPEPARSKLQRLLETHQVNVYTIEKKGVKKLVYQAPWSQDGKCCGFVELVLEIPAEVPHFVRPSPDLTG